MKFLPQRVTPFFCLLLTACAVTTYPGQPGLVTNGYSKIDLEVLMEDGLWVYETTYDNSPKGKGVSAIVTKLYPGARTYTTNVRTNEFGTLYRVKAPYQGSSVQMIAFPLANQYVVSPDSHVLLMVDYEAPLDEVDDQNIAEEGIFSGDKPGFEASPSKLSPLGLKLSNLRFKLLKAGKLDVFGNVTYDVQAIDLAGKVFTPEKSLRIESNLLQTGLRSNIDSKTKIEFIRFLEYHFPQGFKGDLAIIVNGEKIPFSAPITLKTPKIAQSLGAHWTVARNILDYLPIKE